MEDANKMVNRVALAALLNEWMRGDETEQPRTRSERPASRRAESFRATPSFAAAVNREPAARPSRPREP